MNIERIVKLLENSECKQLEGLNCFIVPMNEFFEIMAELRGVWTPPNGLPSRDILTRRHQLENFELCLSSVEKGKYYVCAKSTPVLDELWEKRFKGVSA